MSSIVHRDALTVGIPIQAPNYNNEANDMSLLSYAKKKKDYGLTLSCMLALCFSLSLKNTMNCSLF